MMVMKAIVQDTYGSADVLEVRHIAPPSIGEKDVLVRVLAAGVDRGAGTSRPASRTSCGSLDLGSAPRRSGSRYQRGRPGRGGRKERDPISRR